MRIIGFVISQNRSSSKSLIVVCLLALAVAAVSGPQVWAQQITANPSPTYLPFSFMGSSSSSTINLSNPSSTPVPIRSIWIQGEQFAAGFMSTLVGNPGGIDPATNPSLLPAPASSVLLKYPEALVSGGNETVYIGDRDNNLVLRYDSGTQTVSMFAGTGVACSSPMSPCGDGGPATQAQLSSPRAFTRGSMADLYISDTGTFRIRNVTSPYTSNPPTISTVAGNGFQCTDPSVGGCGDEGPAVSASLGLVLGIARDAHSGDLYIADYDNCRIRRVDGSGVIHAFIGNGRCESSGDGDLASKAGLNRPSGIFVDQLGTLYIAETAGNRVRAVDPITGIISSWAGNGTTNYIADFQPATSVSVPAPRALTVDFLRNLFIVGGDSVVRKVSVDTGIISTVAGTGTAGYNGDTLSALSQLNFPQGATTDGAGNLLIADSNNGTIRFANFFSGNTDQEFTQTNDCPSVLAAGTGCTVTVKLTAALHTMRRAALEVTYQGSNDDDVNLTVPMYGMGVHTYALVSVPAQGALLMPKAAVGGGGTTNTIRFGGSGSFAINYTGVNVNDPTNSFSYASHCAPGLIGSYNYCSVEVTFTPQSGGDKTAQFQFLSDAMNAPQTVNVAGTGVIAQAPIITWKPPATIIYGTRLDGSILNAKANVPGTFQYNYALSSILPVGQAQIVASFQPTDGVAYVKVDTIAGIEVTAAPLAVTPDNVNILLGAAFPALTGKITGIMNNDPISATYVTNAVAGQVGTYQIAATVTASPQVLSNYQSPVLNTGVFTIGSTTGVDLQQNVTILVGTPPYSATAGGAIAFTESVTNNGLTPAGTATTTAYYLSTTGTNNWMQLGSRTIDSLSTGVTSAASPILTLPANVSGNFYVRVCANVYKTVVESNYNNNCSTSPQIVIVSGVNLKVSALSYALGGGSVQVSDTTTNIGIAADTVATTTSYYLSTVNSAGVILNLKWLYLGNRYVPPLASNGSSTASPAPAFALPGFVHGTYKLTACANAYSTVPESSMADNCWSVPIAVP